MASGRSPSTTDTSVRRAMVGFRISCGPMTSRRVELDDVGDGVARMTLCRPDALNALNRDLTAALEDAVETMAARDDVRALVLFGRGRAFCAGNDITEMA